jgi:hypothetical protein
MQSIASETNDDDMKPFTLESHDDDLEVEVLDDDDEPQPMSGDAQQEEGNAPTMVVDLPIVPSPVRFSLGTPLSAKSASNSPLLRSAPRANVAIHSSL